MLTRSNLWDSFPQATSHKRRCVLFLCAFSLWFGQFTLAQSNKKASQFLADLKEPAEEVSSRFLAYTKLVLLEGLSEKSVRSKASLMKEIEVARTDVLQISAFNGQEKLKGLYVNYCNSMAAYLNNLPTLQIASVEFFNNDSAKKEQQTHLLQLERFLEQSAIVRDAVQSFCLLNKVIGVKTSGVLYASQDDDIALLDYAVQVRNAVMGVRRVHRLFFVSLAEDSGRKAEEVRKQLVAAAAEGKAQLLAIPTFKGDKSLKSSALSNLRFHFMASSRSYLRLVNFRDAELAFVQRTIELKEQHNSGVFSEAKYVKETSSFLDNIKANKKEVKALGQIREGREKLFDDNFFDFIEDRFIL